MTDSLERMFKEIRQIAGECEEISIYFKGYKVRDQLISDYNLSFHREPMNAEPSKNKETSNDLGK